MGKLPSRRDQILAWEKIRDLFDKGAALKGHPLFRLGVLHLLEDSSERRGLSYLELAFQEDRKYAIQVGGRAEGRAAYRLLSITKDFLHILAQREKRIGRVRSCSQRTGRFWFLCC